MLRTLQIYWSAHFGCAPEQLFASPFGLLEHGGELVGYHGAFGLFRNGAATVSIPGSFADELRPRLASLVGGCSPEGLAFALQSAAKLTIGPAWIGYATEIAPPFQPVRLLNAGDQDALERLQRACDPLEWEHGGSSLEQPCAGVFADGQLISLAGFEVWGGAIAHISVVTHPAYRNRGAGRSAVAALARRAIDAGLLPQYRTLQANAASIRVAETLGFCVYATSMAVRFRAPELASPER